MNRQDEAALGAGTLPFQPFPAILIPHTDPPHTAWQSQPALGAEEKEMSHAEGVSGIQSPLPTTSLPP